MRILGKQWECAFTAMACLAALVSAEPRPGEVLEDNFPKFEKQGAIYAAAEAPDGGFFVMGDFTEVDGVPRPGLAKLVASGRLDESFDPEIAPEVVIPNTLAPQDAREQVGQYWLNPRRSERLLPLSNGEVIVMGDAAWELRKSNGTINADAFPDLLKLGPTRALPLFEHGGRIFIREISNERENIRAYRSNNFLRDFEFAPEEEIEMVFPASEGSLWGGFQGINEDGKPRRYLTKLFLNGKMDPDFVRVEYFYGRNVELGKGPEIRGLAASQPRRTLEGLFVLLQRVGIGYDNPANGESLRFGYNVPFGGYAGAGAIDPELGLVAIDYDLRSVSRWTADCVVSGFQIPLAGPELGGLNPTETFSILITSNDNILVGGNRKFDVIGNPVADWHVARFSKGAIINGFCQRRNEEVLIFGDFDRVDGKGFTGMISINKNGVLNDQFRPDRDWRFTRQIHERVDGAIIVLSRRGLRDPERNLPRLAVIDELGMFERFITVFPTEEFIYDDHVMDLIGFGVQSSGNMIVNTRNPMNADQVFGGYNHTFFLKPREDGSFESCRFDYLTHWPSSIPFVLSDDRAFVEKKIIGVDGGKVYELPFGGWERVVVLDEDAHGGVVFQKDPVARSRQSTFLRLTPDGEVDSNFHLQKLPREVLAAGHFLSSGKFLLTERQYSRTAGLQPWSPFHDSRIRRLYPNGHVDPTFSVSIPGTAEAIINATIPVGDEIWVGGNFKEIGGVPRKGFARLSGRDLTNFEEWMDTVALDREVSKGPLDDPDGDGANNLAEYAAGTNPLESAVLPGIRWRKNGWRLSMNPDAKDVSRRIEVSENLKIWREAEEGEVEIEEVDHQFRWRIAGKARYCRVVVSLDDRSE